MNLQPLTLRDWRFIQWWLQKVFLLGNWKQVQAHCHSISYEENGGGLNGRRAGELEIKFIGCSHGGIIQCNDPIIWKYRSKGGAAR